MQNFDDLQNPQFVSNSKQFYSSNNNINGFQRDLLEKGKHNIPMHKMAYHLTTDNTLFSNPTDSQGSFDQNNVGMQFTNAHMNQHAGGVESQVDMHIKDRMLAQLSVDNKRLREELTASKGKVFQLEADLDYLRTTIEKNIPIFNQIEAQNKELLTNQRNQTQSQKLVDRL